MSIKAKNVLMQDKAYLEKLEALTQSQSIVAYSHHLFSYLARRLKDEEHDVIVDCGCGTGFNTSLLRTYFPGSRVISVDYTQNNLDFGKKHGYIQEAILSDIYRLKESMKEVAGSVDMLFLGDVIEHLDDPALALKNIYETLKPGGLLVVHTPNKYYSKVFQVPDDPTHIHEYLPRELGAELKSAGFNNISIAPTGIPMANKLLPKTSQLLAYSILGRYGLRIAPFLGPSLLAVGRRTK